MMNTLALQKELKTLGPKQILLTLKKVPRRRHITAHIATLGKNQEAKEVEDRKFIRIITENGNNMFLEEMHNFGKFHNGNKFLPIITRVSMTNRKILSNTEQRSKLGKALISESGFCQNLNKILNERQKNDLRNLKRKSIASTLNKQDRFVPNILRSTKMAENNFNDNNNNNNLIGFDPMHNATDGHGTEKRTDDHKNVKRKRKQVLSSLDMKDDWSRKTNKLKSLRLINNRNSVRERRSSVTLRTIAKKSEKEDDNECPEIKEDIQATTEEPEMETCDRNDVYTADLNIPSQIHSSPSEEKPEVNCNADKSIKEIFAEFEVADYQNYINSEDIIFDIDQMDKLLSSDIDGSIIDSSIFDHVTKIVEYDVNGNSIDSRCDTSNEPGNVRCKIEQCYNAGVEQRPINISEKPRRGLNSDPICCGGWDDHRSHKSEMNSSSTEFYDYYSDNDFHDFHRSPGNNSSSTDTASECETNEFNSTESFDLVLPKIEDLECSASSLVVTDMVPDNVFDDDSNEFCSDSATSDDGRAKQPLNAGATMQQYHLNSDNVNDSSFCTSLSEIPLERFTSNLKLSDGFHVISELFEDGNFLGDDVLSMDCAFSKEDETCEKILANSNAKFDDERVSNMHSFISELDIENVDDIEVSKLLRSGNTHNSPSVSDVILQPYDSNAHANETGIDTANRLHTNDILIPNHDNFQFGTMKFETPMQQEAKPTCNDTASCDPPPDVKFSDETEIQSEEQGCNGRNQDHENSDFSSANTSSRSNQPLSLCDAETKDVDDDISSSRCSPPLIFEKRNINEFNGSRLESLLIGKQRCVDYARAQYFSAVPPNSVTDREIADGKHRTRGVGSSEVDVLDFPVPSTDRSYSHAVQKRKAARRSSVIDLDDYYSVAERRNYRGLESDSPRNYDFHNCRTIPNSVSLWKPAPPGKTPIKLRRLNRGPWQDYVKRCKYPVQNISRIPCDFCEKRYSSAAALADHIEATHRCKPLRFRYKEKKYVCDKCSKEYAMAGAMQRHFQLHENYVLTCRICEKHFSEKIFLRRHVHSEHLDWNIQCSFCSQKFPRRNSLTRHLKKCHASQCFWSESVL